jgi:hypothetical protein
MAYPQVSVAGFQPVQNIQAGDYTGKQVVYPVLPGHENLLAVGDMMSFSGTSDVNGNPYVQAAVAGSTDILVGPISTIQFNPQNLQQVGLPVGVSGFVTIEYDRYSLLQAKISADIIGAAVQLNFPILATAATLTGGLAYSNMKIDTSGGGTTATNQIRIESAPNGLTAGSVVFCRINASTLDTVGV